MQDNLTIVWLRKDLRLEDNPALFYANQHSKKNGTKLFLIFIYENFKNSVFNYGSASKWWLHQSLKKFDFEISRICQKNNNKINSNINFFIGDPEQIFFDLLNNYKIKSVFWNRRYESEPLIRDKKIKKALIDRGIKVKSYNGKTLIEPWNIKGKQGQNLKVFTPYKNSLINNHNIPNPLPKPKDLICLKIKNSLTVENLNLIQSNWMNKFCKQWDVGEKSALKKLDNFKISNVDNYHIDRDFLSKQGTSKLSPHLHFGEISPITIWNKICKSNYNQLSTGKKIYLSEIIWREFAINLMYLYPDLHSKNIKDQFDDFRWNEDKNIFKLWTEGKTGYPVVDAAMIQLWSTGWMHNRARMITASFLTKHLLIPWQWGADWFHDTLLDADCASNYASWQWVAGCGSDAAPYFRIFNPTTQSIKFDPNGEYIKRHIGSLKHLDKKFIHSPDVNQSSNYKQKIIDHKFARERALERYAELKKN